MGIDFNNYLHLCIDFNNCDIINSWPGQVKNIIY